jgi:hypothetical protein
MKVPDQRCARMNGEVYVGAESWIFTPKNLRLQLIRELSEFVEIDTRLKPEEWEIVFGAGWLRVTVSCPVPARIVRFTAS